MAYEMSASCKAVYAFLPTMVQTHAEVAVDIARLKLERTIEIRENPGSHDAQFNTTYRIGDAKDMHQFARSIRKSMFMLKNKRKKTKIVEILVMSFRLIYFDNDAYEADTAKWTQWLSKYPHVARRLAEAALDTSAPDAIDLDELKPPYILAANSVRYE